jgi:dynein heavy chain 1
VGLEGCVLPKIILNLYSQVNVHIVELKSEALKERHWKQLMKQLRVKWVLSDLTLGAVWDVDLVKNEGLVRDVILIAQGEMALEEFLKQVCRSYIFSKHFHVFTNL